MRRIITVSAVITAIALLPDTSGLPVASATQEEELSHMLAKVAAAREVNAYLQFKKGRDGYCLFDPKAMNALSFFFLVDRMEKTITLRSGSRTVTLREHKPHSFKLEANDFTVLMQDHKIAVIDFTTGQSGVIILNLVADAEAEHTCDDRS